jgi:carbon monoxide dehydrogenase subunit G
VTLQYDGQETIPAGVASVWSFVNDPDKVGHCLPEVLEVKVADPTHFDAVVKVALGPVSGRFTFKFVLQPEPGGRRMNMTITGGGFGSAMDLTAGADLVEQDAATTLLNWSGKAVMRGPVAAVGGRVLDAQAKKLITRTFANVREKLSVPAHG